MLLRDPARDFFSAIRPWIRAADLTFANLEGPLSDQGGETGSPANNLVFTGPPAGAEALERAGFSIVSTANNHAWDYGKNALFETMDLLSSAGVRYAGTGRNRQEAYRPTIVDLDGIRIAFVAVTDIWNQGLLERHPGADYVAGADSARLTGVIEQLRASGGAEHIVVSYHGGAEYTDEPLTRTKEILRGAVDAGADLVLGHHPHVTQGIEFYRGKPIFYSLGNLLMRMHRDHPWTEYGFLARATLRGAASPQVEACPYRIFGTQIVPLAGDTRHERRFFEHLRMISDRVGGASIAAPGKDGCAALSPPQPRSP